MTSLLPTATLLRRALPLTGITGLSLAVALCAAAAASAAAPPAEAPESVAAPQPAPKATASVEAAPQPKTAAQAAAAANAAAEAPAAAPAARDPNAPVIRDEEPITPPPGPPPPASARPYTRRTRRLVEPPQAPRGEARQGLLFALGVGGGSQFTSAPGLGRTASTDLDLRLGYGFSDRLQTFIDFNGQSARYGYGQRTSMSTVTLRAQTVLLGDRRGNGLTLNGGIGLGAFNDNADSGYGYDYCCPPTRGGRYYNDKPLGFVVAGGLSYDARLGRYLSLSPELFATWMAVPNDDRKQDIATQMGLRLKLLWYLK